MDSNQSCDVQSLVDGDFQCGTFYSEKWSKNTLGPKKTHSKKKLFAKGLTLRKIHDFEIRCFRCKHECCLLFGPMKMAAMPVDLAIGRAGPCGARELQNCGPVRLRVRLSSSCGERAPFAEWHFQCGQSLRLGVLRAFPRLPNPRKTDSARRFFFAPSAPSTKCVQGEWTLRVLATTRMSENGTEVEKLQTGRSPNTTPRRRKWCGCQY